jgi:hypothetical protein
VYISPEIFTDSHCCVLFVAGMTSISSQAPAAKWRKQRNRSQDFLMSIQKLYGAQRETLTSACAP